MNRTMPPLPHRLADSPLRDAEVVARVLDGDTAAFEILMRRHNQRIYRLTRAVLADGGEAQDAAQLAWIAAYRHLGSWEQRSSFVTWLSRIAVREASRRRRAPHRAHLELVESPDPGPAHGHAQSPEVSLARARVRAILEDAIDALPETMRVVVVLRDVEEMSGPETAAVLGLSASAVRVRLHRARRLLRERLEEVLAHGVGEAYPFLGARCDAIVAAVLSTIEADDRGRG